MKVAKTSNPSTVVSIGMIGFDFCNPTTNNKTSGLSTSLRGTRGLEIVGDKLDLKVDGKCWDQRAGADSCILIDC